MRQKAALPNILLPVLGLGCLPFSSGRAMPETDVCLTSGCVEAAAHILSNLHPKHDSIDPCESFDQYVCGGFPSSWPSEESTSTLKIMDATNQYVLKTILEGSSPNTTTDVHVIFDKLVTNYNSCMNTTAVTTFGSGRISELVEGIVKLFPLKDADYASQQVMDDGDYDAMAHAITYLSEIGVPIFGEFWTIADNQFPDVMIPQFGLNMYQTAEHALPSKITVAELAKIPEDQLKQMLDLILPGEPAKGVTTGLAQGVLAFATAVSRVEAALEKDPDALTYLYHTTTIAEAAEKAPALVLNKVITALAPPGYKPNRMVFQFPDQYSNISSIITETPKPIVQALLIVMAYKSYEPYLNGSTTPEVDRWQTCYAYIDESLPWIASKLFMDIAYSDEKRGFIETMAGELKNAFSERVKNLDWLDKKTKEAVGKKIADVLPKIGSPEHSPNTQNATDLAEYYSTINITDSHFNNALSIRKWSVNQAWLRLNSPADRTLWPERNVHAYNAAARYGFNYNHIAIPAGMAQSPLFFEGAPSYLIYSTIGFVVGHEITHGFDSNGRFWNEDRQYNQPWWDDESVTGFEDRAKCFADQFSQMKATDYNGKPFLNDDDQPAFVDGDTTLAENIADAGGLTMAWDAWKTHEETNASLLLPGLEKFTKDQLFFIGRGQVFCSKHSTDDMMDYLANNTHAPPFARILNSAHNSRAFREAWRCKKKEPICELW